MQTKVLILWLSVCTKHYHEYPGNCVQLKARAAVSYFRCGLLWQLPFNSVPDAYLVHIILILFIMEKIVLSPIWCDFIRDKMSIKEGVEAVAATKLHSKSHSGPEPFDIKL